MKRLKADPHTHAADDPFDTLSHSAEMLIDAVAAAGMDVLAITCHDLSLYTHRLFEYAGRRNVLLIPGIEKFVSAKHVLILNPDPEHLQATTFDELREIGRRDAAFVAPHPYYPAPSSLLGDLVRNIDLFDAIEWSSLYMRTVNPNRWAARTASRYGLPLLGTSDTHGLPYEDTTYSWIEAEPTAWGVVEAIRAGRVTLETRPKPARAALRSAFDAVRGIMLESVNV
jgi:predicted metal-dependent phosphoesterase TrpH